MNWLTSPQDAITTSQALYSKRKLFLSLWDSPYVLLREEGVVDSSDLSLVPLSVSDTDIGGEIVFLPSRTYGLIAGETGPLPRLFFFSFK